MKIAYIVDYLPNLDSRTDFSGAEVSVQLLAAGLKKHGVEIKLVSPAQGLYSSRGKVFPSLLTTNIFWFFLSTLIIIRSLQREEIDLIHAQGKNSLVGAYLSSLFFKKQLLVTVRDYRALCDLGMCFLRGKKHCTFKNYFQQDIPFFVRKYKKQTVLRYLYAYLVGLYQYPLRLLYRHILKKANKVVCISIAQQKLYNTFGIDNTIVIYNPVTFEKVHYQKKKQLFFGGRYTLGKGKEILKIILPKFFQLYPDWELIFAGRDKLDIEHRNIRTLGQLPYKSYLRSVGESSLALVPSVWPEPFGRAALDAISVGTPVVATNAGALSEIVVSGRYGTVSQPNTQSYWQALQEGMAKRSGLSEQIKKDTEKLIKKFQVDPVQDHLRLYESSLHKS
ncbi:MAG: Glycosyl transferase group 1 [Microgenomates group bacterium GW2011_GWA1_48_10]|nr:MAG: Glycosyl transferase group 1 [Microgenomates group bacterium GW2011_GWA1_48_10]